jgi:hypothetical protein
MAECGFFVFPLRHLQMKFLVASREQIKRLKYIPAYICVGGDYCF